MMQKALLFLFFLFLICSNPSFASTNGHSLNNKQVLLAGLPPGCLSTDGKGACTRVQTAVGVLHTDASGLIYGIFGLLLSLSGGVAVLLLIGSGYQLMTSQGNPEKVKEGRERLTSAIVGLIFIIFSVAILQIIGIQILQIPGFK